jgi:glyoxylase-like metal-dependent hydrolase (beta-lactamase superfamily II)
VGFETVTIDPAPLEAAWRHGRRRGDTRPVPPFEVRRVVAGDDTTFVIRQSKHLTYEAPFLHLLVGTDRALLLDTGAVADPSVCSVREVVDALLPSGFPLVVAHTHGHGDHVAGDGHFAGRPSTVVVGRDEEAAIGGWGFTSWPEEVVTFDLGDRPLEVTGIPGHHPTSVAVHDPRTRTLYTGDTVYPGRLYAADPTLFAASIGRLAAFASERPVDRVLGCHIELRRGGGDYPLGARYQPDEVPFPLTMADLLQVAEGVRWASGRRGVHHLGPAILWNEPCRLATAHHLLRLLLARVRGIG